MRILNISKQTIGALLTVGLFVLAPLPALAALDQLEAAPLPTSDPKQTLITKQINSLLQKHHYRGLTLDDAFSERVLDRYIEQLDGSKSFFLQGDIDQFKSLEHEFDDFIREGNLEPAYAIFRIYRTRVEQRVQFAIDRLEQPFDFSLDEYYVLDAETADWQETMSGLDDLWRKRIKNDILNLRLAGKDETEIRQTLDRRYTHIARRTRQFQSDDVFQSFINAYVSTIEPHTSYYSPRGAENFKIHMRLSLEGIGAVLQTDNEHTLVRRIIPGGPADMSGELAADDRIIGVGQADDEIIDVIGWRLDDVVDLIRGPKESVVTLEILPGETGLDGESETISIVRDEIKLEEQAASSQILEVENDIGQSKVGIITLPSFYSDFDGRSVNDPNYRSTTRDVRNLIKELEQQDIDGLVIDLRGNGGGALSEAIALTGLFIKQGPVVQVQSSSGRTQVDRDPDPEIQYKGPLAVVVDRFSASASEIFAGAIQDYNRGLIIGEPTFGKGTVQNLVNLNRWVNYDEDLGQLKITIAQFVRINGDSTQHRGVVPDIVWHTSEAEEESGERALENAIPWRSIGEVSYVPFDTNEYGRALEQSKQNYLTRALENPEFEYRLGINALNREARDIKQISLQDERRREIREQRDSQRLTLENTLRESQGESALSSVSDLEDQDVAIEDDAYIDPFLRESGNILVDFALLAGLFPGSPDYPTLVERDASKSDQELSN